MRRFVGAIAVSVSAVVGPAATAAAPHWTRIAEGPGQLTVFYARKVHGGAASVRRIELLYDYQEPQQDPDTLVRHRSAVVSAGVDCRGNRIRMGAMTKYSGALASGERVEQTRAANPEFRPVKPDSIDAKVVRFACASGS